jgi:hypothetical protein
MLRKQIDGLRCLFIVISLYKALPGRFPSKEPVFAVTYEVTAHTIEKRNKQLPIWKI